MSNKKDVFNHLITKISGVLILILGFSLLILPKQVEAYDAGDTLTFGRNDYGQLAIGNTNSPVIAPTISTGLSAIKIAQMQTSTYANVGMDSLGNVYTWGWNGVGQLGNGIKEPSATTTPIQVSGLSNVVKVGTGNYSSAALTQSGDIYYWGGGGYCWDAGSTFCSGADRTSPVESYLSGGTSYVDMAVGFSHLVGLTADGNVYTVGDGIMGNGSSWTSYPVAPVMANITDVVKVYAGDGYTLALKSDGTVWGWGSCWYFQLGNGICNDQWSDQIQNPTKILDLDPNDNNGKTIINVSTTANTWSAVGSDGSVWYVGNEIINGYVSPVTTPLQIPGISNATSSAQGGDYTLIKLADQTVAAWGYNGNGQLGLNKVETDYPYIDDPWGGYYNPVELTPVIIPDPANPSSPLAPVTQIYAGYYGSSFVVMGVQVITYGVTSITPVNIPGTIPTLITIKGNLLDTVTSVTVGGEECSNLTLVSITELNCVSPILTSGNKTIIVTNSNNETTSYTNYTYTGPGSTATSCNSSSNNSTAGVGSANTSVELCILSGILTNYAGDSNNNNDICTPSNISSSTVVDTTKAGQNASSVTCSSAENSVALTGLSVSSVRQSATATVDDIVFEDLRGLASANYTLTATISDFTSGSKSIQLGSNPDNANSDADQDAPTGADTNKLFATMNCSAGNVEIIRNANTMQGGISNYVKGSSATVVSTSQPVTLLYTSNDVLPGRVSLDGCAFKVRVPAFVQAGSYSGTIVQTIV
ncbi:MAG: hypothetical protein OHK0017_06890 [Patescibacteria group bacterium]